MFLFIKSRSALGPTQPPVEWIPEAITAGVRRPGREAVHSPPFRNGGAIPPLPYMSSWHGASPSSVVIFLGNSYVRRTRYGPALMEERLTLSHECTLSKKSMKMRV
jgi:hypothetical protein